VVGVEPAERRAARTCITYTSTTVRDAALSGYNVFGGVATAGVAEVLPESERAMFAALVEDGTDVPLCHLNRLVRRTATCEHMACTTDAAGRCTCERFAGGGGGDGTAPPPHEEPGTARKSTIDFIRFRTLFLDEALSAVQECDYLELFFGRRPPPYDEYFAPLMIRGRILDATQQRVLITRVAFVAPNYDDK